MVILHACIREQRESYGQKAEKRWSTSSGGYDATGGVVPQSLSSVRLWNYRCFVATTLHHAPPLDCGPPQHALLFFFSYRV